MPRFFVAWRSSTSGRSPTCLLRCTSRCSSTASTLYTALRQFRTAWLCPSHWGPVTGGRSFICHGSSLLGAPQPLAVVPLACGGVQAVAAQLPVLCTVHTALRQFRTVWLCPSHWGPVAVEASLATVLCCLAPQPLTVVPLACGKRLWLRVIHCCLHGCNVCRWAVVEQRLRTCNLTLACWQKQRAWTARMAKLHVSQVVLAT